MSFKKRKISVDEFAKWIQSEETEVCLVEYKHPRAYFKNRLPNGLDILYMYRHITDDTISVYTEVEYQGLYKRDTKELYDVGYETSEILKETNQIMYGSANIIEDIEVSVRTLVEDMVSEYAEKVTVNDVTEERLKIIEKQAWEIAKKRYLEDIKTDYLYQCDYSVDEYRRNLVEFITNRDEFLRYMAEKYHQKNLEDIREGIIRNRYIKAELEKFNNGEYCDYTAMKGIINSIPKKSQTVNVTICKDGKEMTFKYEARHLKYDCGGSYSTWYMPCLARGNFDDLYGRNAKLYPTDITRITYGRKVIYEEERENEKENKDYFNNDSGNNSINHNCSDGISGESP